MKPHICLIVINDKADARWFRFLLFGGSPHRLNLFFRGWKAVNYFSLPSYQQLAIKLSRGHLYQILHACHHQASHQALHSSLLPFPFPPDSILFPWQETQRGTYWIRGMGGEQRRQRRRCTHISWLIIRQRRQQSFICVPAPAGWLFLTEEGE